MSLVTILFVVIILMATFSMVHWAFQAFRGAPAVVVALTFVFTGSVLVATIVNNFVGYTETMSLFPML